MFRDSISWYIFTFTLLELIIKTHLTLHDSSHGFISKNPRYFDDELSSIHEEITTLRTSRMNEIPLKQQLRFEPSFLDFQQRALGIPHLEKVTLFNVDKNKSIDMTSISGSTVHFHSSFFEHKRIPPNGNTSFNVVFLGREEGFVESSLFIHTSEGFLKYNVKGSSTFSQYRIRPIIGIKLPLNSSFSPFIYMHNPHSEPIQIVEIYSSGGGFHLELPTGEQEGPNDMWQIPPQYTKPIIRVRFQAKVVQNHTAYVRIKLNRPDEILVVPLEVEVISGAGLFHPQGHVDFGVGGNLDAPKEMKLCLYNPSKKYLKIHSVSTLSKAIKVQYQNVRLQPESENDKKGRCVDVGTLTVDWKIAYDTKDFLGKIIVKYRNGKNKSEIPYHLTVLKGGIGYDPLTTTYFINDRAVDLAVRVFKIKNDFECPLHVTDVIFLQDTNFYFNIETLTPKVVRPGEETAIFNIKLKNNIRLSDLQQLQTNIFLRSNISTLMVRVLSYNGKLQVHLPFKTNDYSLDIGLISFNTKKEVYFMLVNHNPVTLNIKSVDSSIPMTTAEIYGCGMGDYKLTLFQASFPNLTRCHHVKSNYYAIIKVTVNAASIEGQTWGDINIETQFEHLRVPVHFKIAPGKLEIGPDRLVFDQCFPAKICTHPLRVHSTFSDPMIIEDIITLPPDKRISNKHTGHILARTSKIIGHLFLNPDLECKAECYAGLQTDTSAQWLKSFALSKFISDFDLHLVNLFYNRYLNVTANCTRKWQNITLRLDTSEIKGHIFKTRVKMSWPSLIAESSSENRSFFGFPLTQVGNITYQNITVRNPASYNVVIQLLFDRDYPNLDLLLNGLPLRLKAKVSRDYIPSHNFFFHNESHTQHLNFFWEMLGVEANKKSIPIILAPGQSQSIQIGFFSNDINIHTALLFLRNNLTILEAIRLKGQAAFPLFKFGNRKPGSLQNLAFDITDTHLTDCQGDRSALSPPNLTVKRTFTARNIGDITVFVNTFYINDLICEGYGYKVIDCEPFMLAPNATKKIDIAFTPDLTLTKVTRMLILDTSLNIPVNYTLHSTIPHGYLNLCAALLARPFWEIYLYYISINVMVIMLVLVLFLAMMDAERMRKQALGSFMTSNSPSIQPVLDLRVVGQQIREEIQSVKTEPLVEGKTVQFEDKASQKELEEDVGPKVETERYTVLVPTTGRAKKKLGKKNSNEVHQSIEANDLQISEKPEKKKEKHFEIKYKIKDKNDEKDVQKVDEKDKKSIQSNIQKEREVKKLYSQINKKQTKNSTSVPVYEEETSSTTTDSSSSNYDDPEKENSQRRTKFNLKPKLSSGVKSELAKPTFEENVNHTETKYGSLNHNHHYHNKLKHQKSNLKLTKPNEKQYKEQEHHIHNKHIREMKRKERASKDRKDKSGYHKKLLDKNKQSERQSKLSESDNVEKRKSPNYFNVPLPPVTTSSIWGESRAKFSDVVARNDTLITTTCITSSSNVTRPLIHGKQSMTNKPTMYVEPYKQTPTELGPIGSKRADSRRSSNDTSRRLLADDNYRFLEDNFHLSNENSDSMNDVSQLHGLDDVNNSNSFFSEDMLLDNNSDANYLEELTSVGNNWNNQQNFINLMDSRVLEANNAMKDPWNQSLLNSSSYWSSYSPLLSETPLIDDASTSLVTETSLLEQNSTLSSGTNQQSSISSSSEHSTPAGYLWGSSSVWQPWTPSETIPGTPTRTPPGFRDNQLKKKDEQTQQQMQDSYSPFNTTNLWTQQQNNPWNYSQGQ